MDPITIFVDPEDYFRKGKEKISEGMKHLQDLVQRCNTIPENVALVDEIMAYLQSLQRQVAQEIDSVAQRGEAHASSNINTTYLDHGQEITQIREQNEVIQMVTNTNVENSSCSKRKRRSEVWKVFTKYVDKNGKEKAQCKHCKREFVGSSKSGTTHLKNHLKSCPRLKNPDGVVDFAKEKTVIGSGCELARNIIKYGLNAIKNDIFDVYQQENDKLHGYLDKLSCRFNGTIEFPDGPEETEIWVLRIWFIEDNWELKNMIISLGQDIDHFYERVKSSLVDWNIVKRICSMRGSEFFHLLAEEKEKENICNFLNEQSLLPFNWNCSPISFLRDGLRYYTPKYIPSIRWNYILGKVNNLCHYVRTNENKFQLAVINVVSKGKKVTSHGVPPSRPHLYLECMIGCEVAFRELEWIMGCKEAFCELELIDPDFKPINFTEDDWDEAILLCNNWKVLNDCSEDVDKLLDCKHTKYKTANAYSLIFFRIFLKLIELENFDNHYFRPITRRLREELDEYWSTSGLVLVITIILDPRFKRDIVEDFCKKKYGNGASAHFNRLIDDVTNIFNEYAKDTNRSISSSSSESELNHYFTDSMYSSSEGFNILEWWRLNSSTYPTLARMARDYLSIPLSLEELVIYSSNILDDDLKDKLVCTKIWLNNLDDN